MSVSGIQGSAGSSYIAASRRNRNVDNAVQGQDNRNTGPDTVSFSEDALRKAGIFSADSGGVAEEKPASGSSTQTDEADSAAASKSLTNTGKKSLFAMMLESLFLAEIEESSAGGNRAANAETVSEDQMPGRQAGKSEPGNPMQDGEKVAALKKVINDFMQGKADLSDLPKAMAVGSSGGMGGTTRPVGGNNANTSGSGGKDMENTIG